MTGFKKAAVALEVRFIDIAMWMNVILFDCGQTNLPQADLTNMVFRGTRNNRRLNKNWDM